MNKKAERGMETRRLLLDVGTRLFTERGYEHTPIEAVLEESGVSRGALYHHFGGKDKLFEAVLDQVETDIGTRLIAAAADAGDVREALRRGCLEWIRAAKEPLVRQIVLKDAPAVLGWQRWREMEERYALGTLRLALLQAAEENLLPAEFVDTFAHVLLAAMNELALLSIRVEDNELGNTVGRAVEEILGRLLRVDGT